MTKKKPAGKSLAKPESTNAAALVTAEQSVTLREPGNPIEAKKPECGAKLRKKDALCRSTQLMQNLRCRIHGGKSPGGIASPHHKHGRFSRVMPQHLADRFNEIKADPELISNRENLALVNTLLEERLQMIYEGCPPEAWKLARRLLKEYENALEDKDEFVPIYNRKGNQINSEPDPEEDLARLRELLIKGIMSAEAFELTAGMIETHRRAVDTEYKLVKENQNRMDVAEVRMYASRLADAVKRHVKDPETLRLIQADLRRIISPGS